MNLDRAIVMNAMIPVRSNVRARKSIIMGIQDLDSEPGLGMQ
jgi:hypothetical protein